MTREDRLFMLLALAAKDAGLLDAELTPLEMLVQGQILSDALEAHGLDVTIGDDE